MHTFDFSTYRSKVYGCFVGKCVGGTLGMKYEGTLRQADMNNQGICDVAWYAALKSDRQN